MDVNAGDYIADMGDGWDNINASLSERGLRIEHHTIFKLELAEQKAAISSFLGSFRSDYLNKMLMVVGADGEGGVHAMYLYDRTIWGIVELVGE